MGSPEDERFWLPPPESTSILPTLRAELPTFPSPPLRVSRVGQLDGALLDQELEGILAAPVWKALAGLRSPGRTTWEPEMLALLRAVVLKLSLWDRGATYGSSLQNLKYRNERKHRADALQSTASDSALTPIQKTAYILLEVLPAYLHARIRDRMLSAFWSDEPLPRSWFSLFDIRRASKRRRRRTGEEDGRWAAEWKRVVWEVLSVGERLGAILGLANFLVFLYDGRYRTLVDRLLGMRLIYAQRSINRNVSFEFLNRQLVWEAFTEFLLFLVPLINLHRVRQRALKFLVSTTSNSKTLSTVLSALPLPVTRALGLPSRQPPSAPKAVAIATDTLVRPQGALHFLPPTTCPICYSNSTAPPTELPATDPTTSTSFVSAPGTEDTTVKVPYVTDCGWGCRYCYYCIVGKLVECQEEGEDHWTCLRCGGDVRAAEKEPPAVVEIAVKVEEASEEAVDDQAEVEEGEEEESDGDGASVGSEHDRWRE